MFPDCVIFGRLQAINRIPATVMAATVRGLRWHAGAVSAVR